MKAQKSQAETSTSNPLVKSLLKASYIIHLIVIAIFSTYIIIKHRDVVSLTVTFFMIIIYGYMALWAQIIGFLLVMCKYHEKAAVFTRVIVKAIILCFPIFGLLSISKDNQLEKQEVHIFIIYMGVITLCLLTYEIVSCVCYTQEHPQFLFVQNNLQRENQTILSKRKEYNDFVATL